jgi:hypothetical protein
MSRFSYSLDVGEELAREKEVKRKIAAKGEEEETVRLDPKFEQEILQLAEEKQVTYEEDDSIVITPKIKPAKEAPKPTKVMKSKPEARPEAKTSKPEAKESKPELKEVKKKEVKPKKEEKKAEPVPLKVAPKSFKIEATPMTPTPDPAPLHTEPRTPGDGSGRLVLALLLISVIAIILIYSGLASQDVSQKPAVPCSVQFADNNNLTLVSLSNLTGPQQYWFKKALLADNEAEASAIMRMVLCTDDSLVLSEDSNPMNFSYCDYGSNVISISESDMQSLVGLSNSSKCDSLDDVIICDNDYSVEGIMAYKDDERPQYFIAKAGGKYTVIESTGLPIALAVMSDKSDKFVAYTLPVESRNKMAMKLFVGDDFSNFKRVYLDHKSGNDRVVVYKLI